MQKLSRRFALGTLMAISLSGLTSCSQSQIYAIDKSSGVYVTIPKGWHKISNKQLNSAEAKSTAEGAAERLASVVWQEAYSTSPETLPLSIFSLESPKKGAVVYVRVRDLSYDDLNSVSYNSLRNIILPITTWLEDPEKANPKFALFDDYERVEKIARGVRTIYTFDDPNEVSQTVDQTAMVSDDRSRIYLVLVRASTKYFKKHGPELQKIGDSFTVRGNK